MNIDNVWISGKQILKDTEKYFTEDVMNQLDEAAKKNFLMVVELRN